MDNEMKKELIVIYFSLYHIFLLIYSAWYIINNILFDHANTYMSLFWVIIFSFKFAIHKNFWSTSFCVIYFLFFAFFLFLFLMECRFYLICFNFFVKFVRILNNTTSRLAIFYLRIWIKCWTWSLNLVTVTACTTYLFF